MLPCVRDVAVHHQGGYGDPMPQGIEWVVILVVILLLFGGAKLPQLARSLGQAQKEFKKGQDEGLNKKADEPESNDAG